MDDESPSIPFLRVGRAISVRAEKPSSVERAYCLALTAAGGFAERVAVPTSLLHDIPDTLDWDHAGLIEPVANALHAWHLAGSPSGQRIGVIGGGPIGLACIEIALANNAAHVACAELSSDRRNVAKKIGAHSSERKARRRVRRNF
jgi:threonine dehydrogenase-like Zn-dependent dehydrogenase